MSVRGVIPAFMAAILALTPVVGYAFNLSQMLGGDAQNLNTFKLIHVPDLKALLAKGGDKVHIYDANIDPIREKFGVIKGATLLASDDDYSLSLLPHNKHAVLVFYCTNSH